MITLETAMARSSDPDELRTMIGKGGRRGAVRRRTAARGRASRRRAQRSRRRETRMAIFAWEGAHRARGR